MNSNVELKRKKKRNEDVIVVSKMVCYRRERSTSARLVYHSSAFDSAPAVKDRAMVVHECVLFRYNLVCTTSSLFPYSPLFLFPASCVRVLLTL